MTKLKRRRLTKLEIGVLVASITIMGACLLPSTCGRQPKKPAIQQQAYKEITKQETKELEFIAMLLKDSQTTDRGVPQTREDYLNNSNPATTELVRKYDFYSPSEENETFHYLARALGHISTPEQTYPNLIITGEYKALAVYGEVDEKGTLRNISYELLDKRK